MQITESFIKMQAPNPKATDSGLELSKKGKFSALGRNAEGNTFWAECAGSGSKPYRVSVDFSRGEEQPVCRCSCPSRQFPCKHALGLMFEIAAGKQFTEGEIPAELAEKQAKQAAKAAKAAAKPENAEGEAPAKPKRVNTSAQKKKLDMQLEGLDLADKMTEEILSKGISALGGTSAADFEKLAKNLGNYYLSGFQTAFERIALMTHKIQYEKSNAELYYSECLRILISLRALSKRSREYLKGKLDSGNYAAEDSALFEALGGVWKLENLHAAGLFRENARLIQLSFDVSYDEAKKEYVERGFWLDISCGEIVHTLNLRPAKALKYVKAEDSCFELLEVPTLYKYPGTGCTRVRWDGFSPRPLLADDIAALKGCALGSIAEVVKAAKNQFKDPLAPKYMPALLSVEHIGKIGDAFAAEDASGVRVEMRDRREDGYDYRCTARLQPGSAVFGLIFYDSTDGHICLHPYSVISDDGIIRLNG